MTDEVLKLYWKIVRGDEPEPGKIAASRAGYVSITEPGLRGEGPVFQAVSQTWVDEIANALNDLQDNGGHK